MRLAKALSLLAAVLLVAPSQAAGPLLLFDPGAKIAYAYPSGMMPLPVYADSGSLGPISKASADGVLAGVLSEWSSVPTSSFSASLVGDIVIGGDIDTSTVGIVLDSTLTPGVHVVYDDDGSIIADVFGLGSFVLGIGLPKTALSASADLVESFVILNGAAVDPADVSGGVFAGVFAHEFGHAINLAHSQTNGSTYFFGNPDYPATALCPPPPWATPPLPSDVETMYPFLDVTGASTTGAEQATIEKLDDKVSLSDLYPAAGYPGVHATIFGTIFYPDGVTELTGVNVICRNVMAGRSDAVSMMSGAWTQGLTGPDGTYVMNGLTSGADYIVYIDGIVAGGFSTSPAPDPFIEEYFDVGESAFEDPCIATPVTPFAGLPIPVDIITNADACVLADCGELVTAFPGPVSFDLCFTNCGPIDAMFDYSVADDSLWCSASPGPLFVASGMTACVTVDCVIPSTTPAGSMSELTFVVTNSTVSAVSDTCTTIIGVLGSVPVSLVSFQGWPEEDAIRLRWRLGDPHELSGVRVQRSDSRNGSFRNRDVLDPAPAMEFEDGDVRANTSYWYRLVGERSNGSDLVWEPIEVRSASRPESAALRAPSIATGGAVEVVFTLDRSGEPSRLAVLDVGGRWVRTLDRGTHEAGPHRVTWDLDDDAGHAVGSGVYFLTLTTDRTRLTRKLIVAR